MRRIFRDPRPRPGPSVVCVGAFDGVHRGHLALLGRAVALAASEGLRPVALTMEPLPREFLRGAEAPPRILPLRDRLRALLAAGMAEVGVMRFDRRLAALSAADFARRWLAQALGARRVVVGADFRFGHGREGDVPRLRELGAALGFAVEVPETVLEDGEPVSSTRLRAALLRGDLAAAERLLGRPLELAGRVRRGRALGRMLGFPTANLPLGRRRYALEGVFAVRADGAGLRDWPGVASVGTRPTLGGGETVLEVHLFDFAGDLYGQRLRVRLLARLREERRFPSLESMVAAMRQDALRAREALAV